MTQSNKLLLFDGSSLAFRAFYGLHDLDRFKNKEGLHTNALYAFHLMLTHLLEVEKPTHALVAWDAGKTTFRTKMYKDYKGGRASTPTEFKEQMPFFNRLLDGFGIPHTELVNYEADDIIGTLAMQAAEKGLEVVIVSGDKDLTQLARDHVRVEITRKGVTQLATYTPESILQNQGIRPEQIIDVKALMGDSSDNYPGVTGIGEKNALKLIQDFGSVEGVYENLDQVTGKKRLENLKNDKEQAFLSKTLAKIILDAPVEVKVEELAIPDKNIPLLTDFYREMNFNQFLTQLLGEEKQGEISENQDLSVDYEWVSEITEEQIPTESAAFYVEMLETNYHLGKILALVWKKKDKIYGAFPEAAWASTAFKEWLADETRKKKVFDSKRTRIMLERAGVTFEGVEEDLLIVAYLIYAKDLSGDLAQIAMELGQTQLSFEEQIYGKGKNRSLPEDQTKVEAYLAQKVAMIDTLLPMLLKRLEEDQLMDLYRQMELPLAKVLANMESQGMYVSIDCLKSLAEEYKAQLKVLEEAIYQEAGESFNINSTQQLSHILFEKMGLKGGKKTKSGKYSTAQGELEKLKGEAIIDLILDYRQLAKLQSTYVEGILDDIHIQDQKVHTRFIQTLTTTGRLSSADPNLQNIPIRTEEGRKIRKAFLSEKEDWVIFSSDYSQIELRVLAHMSGDKHLREAFLKGKDIHTATASKVFHKPEEDVSSEERRKAKAVNFGIVYGISDYGLSQNLHISRAEAKQFIDKYFEIYPDVAKYMTRSVEVAKEKGYAETLFHRRRYLPDLKAKNFNLRSFAERTAMNSPIQGTAADIIKVAMLHMAKALEKNDLKCNLLLQVHDELIFEVAKSDLARLEALVRQVMEEAVSLSIPLVVDCNYGKTWYDVK